MSKIQFMTVCADVVDTLHRNVARQLEIAATSEIVCLTILEAKYRHVIAKAFRKVGTLKKLTKNSFQFTPRTNTYQATPPKPPTPQATPPKPAPKPQQKPQEKHPGNITFHISDDFKIIKSNAKNVMNTIQSAIIKAGLKYRRWYNDKGEMVINIRGQFNILPLSVVKVLQSKADNFYAKYRKTEAPQYIKFQVENNLAFAVRPVDPHGFGQATA